MNIEWQLLKKPLLCATAVALCSAAVITVLWLRYEATHARYSAAHAARTAAYVRYQRAESDAALFKQYRSRFLDYKHQGIIGEENRLSWAEVLHQQDLALSLPLFNIEISPRQKHYPAAVPRRVQWFKSSQSIQASLLHEGDLLQMLTALQKRAAGLFRVASCQLQRAPTIQFAPQAANVSADCVLHWYSLHISRPEEASNASPH